MRRALPLALLALTAAPAAAQAAERVVDMPAKYFVPPNLTTLAGDTVTWTNDGPSVHTATAGRIPVRSHSATCAAVQTTGWGRRGEGSSARDAALTEIGRAHV